MMVIKCKMCGGDILFTPGDTYGTCDSCGTVSTIPKADDENKLNRYNRANHFRRQCEFDKALTAYEKLLEQDETDAEAHWGAVISRFGIEYVEDPASGKRVPTCHRVQVSSILADADYLAAVENAPDAQSRRIYQEEAQRIAEIQKGILAISANEKPYDVFICYKETDEKGQRTHDSQWAQDVYYGLTEQGYKVFFSRITLEDKLGQQYEPYIFAALNSAKVMVVIGSKPEYFNAVWVKNEWSRYLALMAADRKRLLIPCYRDMDPYDLPEELSSLQSQDMSKIGFMQDLLRGVKKVLEADKKPEQPKVVQQLVQTSAADAASPGVSSLMKRVRLFMEDEDFAQAEEYLNRVLDIDPEFAEAYAAKLCVSLELRKESDLAETTFQYETQPDWQKALRFADARQKAAYLAYAAKVKERVEKQIRDYAYDCAVEMAVKPEAEREELEKELEAYKMACAGTARGLIKGMPNARPDGGRRSGSKLNEDAFQRAVHTNEPGEVSEQALKTAASMFEAIKDLEAAECARQCRTLAEQARMKKIYLGAVALHKEKSKDPAELEQAAKVFASVSKYKDAGKQAQNCLSEAESIRRVFYDRAVNTMKEAENSEGNEAKKLHWEEARKLLSVDELNGYRNIEQLRSHAEKAYADCLKAIEAYRQQQKEQLERKIAAEAAKKKRVTIISLLAAVLAVAAFFVVTKVIIPNQNYQQAMALRSSGQYEEAIAAFTALGDYNDAAAQLTETYYQQALALRSSGQYEEAIAAFTALGDYNDAATQLTETQYQQAQALLNQGNYAGAAAIFITIKEYKDVDTLLTKDDNLSAAAAAAAAAARKAELTTVGNYISFGHYEQDNNTANGKEAIEWQVLEVKGNAVLVISRYGLDAQAYNTSYTDITWEKCTLRTWLNGTFMKAAFTTAEQAAINTTTVDNSSKQGYSGWSTSGGNNTQDKLFLLSYAEANTYFNVSYNDSNNTKARVQPTAYAIAQGSYTSSSYKTAGGAAAGWWWLRSPGGSQYYAAYVYTDGSLSGRSVDNDGGCVRPAFPNCLKFAAAMRDPVPARAVLGEERNTAPFR